MKWWQGLDRLGLGLYFLICIFAIININSVDEALGTKQLIFFCISLFVGFLIFVTRSKFFENMAGIIYIGGILLLVGLFPFGTEILGQKNWYKFGSITMQPVEFAKIGTALMLANYVANPDFNLKYSKSLWTSLILIGVPAVVVLAIPDVGSLLVFGAFVIALYREGLSGWLFIVIFALGGIFFSSLIFSPLVVSLVIGVAAVLVFISYLKDIQALPINGYFLLILGGFSMLILHLFFSENAILSIVFKVISVLVLLYLLFVLGKIIYETIKGTQNTMVLTRAGVILLISGIAISISVFSEKILTKMPKHQRERIEVLYKGEKQFRETSGYNLLYSKTAIGSGGYFGKGYQQGSVTQGKFVPEQETDYIFCTVGEEWGFVGSTLLILVYALYIGRIYYLAERQKSVFNRVFGYSFASILLIHFSINLGMVMGLFPTVGIPLPYFSYGGSSLLAFSIMTAIFFKLNYADRNSLV